MSNRVKVRDRAEKAREAAEDARLVALVVEGHTDAFDRLVRRYQRRAVAVAYRLLGNADDAADVAQDALLRAYRNLGQLADPRSFGAWLLRIVSNLSLNYRRSRRGLVSGDEILDSSDRLRGVDGAILTEGPAGSQQTEAGELRRVVDDAMQSLPEKQRLSLVLFSVEGMPQQEVAQVLECSVELVKWNVYQARKHIKRALAGSAWQQHGSD